MLLYITLHVLEAALKCLHHCCRSVVLLNHIFHLVRPSYVFTHRVSDLWYQLIVLLNLPDRLLHQRNYHLPHTRFKPHKIYLVCWLRNFFYHLVGQHPRKVPIFTLRELCYVHFLILGHSLESSGRLLSFHFVDLSFNFNFSKSDFFAIVWRVSWLDHVAVTCLFFTGWVGWGRLRSILRTCSVTFNSLNCPALTVTFTWWQLLVWILSAVGALIQWHNLSLILTWGEHLGCVVAHHPCKLIGKVSCGRCPHCIVFALHSHFYNLCQRRAFLSKLTFQIIHLFPFSRYLHFQILTITN